MNVGVLIAGLAGGIAIWLLLTSYLVRRSASGQVALPAGAVRRQPRLEGFADVDAFVIPAGLFAVTALGYALINGGRQAGLDYFVPLANAFLHGHAGLSTPGNAHFGFLTEILPGKHGEYDVAYPPAPAVVLMPAVAVFGIGFNQAWMTIFLGALNVALMSIAIANLGGTRRLRVILALVFGFGTVVWFSAQIGTAWHMSHVVALTFMLLAIVACQRDRSMFLIGLFFAGAIASRMAVLLAMPFFLAYAVDRVKRERQGFDVRRYVELVVPMFAGLGLVALLLFAYDYDRFGSVLETGYGKWDFWQTNPAYRFGMFSVHYFHKDFTALFLSLAHHIGHVPWLAPDVYGGPSILLTSPIFLWALKARGADWFTIGAWSSVVLILLTQLLYADTGGNQFGSETAQDAYPFLMLLTVRGLNGRISRLAWAAIAVGLVVNAWGIGFAVSDWWHFGRGV